MSNYNFNEELCKKLNNGEIAVHYNNGNLEMLRALLKKCAPEDDVKTMGVFDYYYIINNLYAGTQITHLKPVPLSDFIVKDSKPFEWTDELALEFSVSPYSTISPLRNGLEQFKASKQRKCLFTTEDRVNIYHGDTYWYVEVDNNFDITRTTACSSEQQIPECKDFSTEAAAIEYVRLNKPMYSLNDIGDAWEKLYHEAFTYDQLITELEKLKK